MGVPALFGRPGVHLGEIGRLCSSPRLRRRGQPGVARWIPATASGFSLANHEVTPAPRSLPWATYRRCPSPSVISLCHSSATALPVSPPAGGEAENPKPGSDGTTTVNASAGSAPWRAGSVRRGRRSRYSQNELGHPWVSSSGKGSEPLPKAWTTWSCWPSTSAEQCSSWSSRAWNSATSYDFQSCSRPVSQDPGTPSSQRSGAIADRRLRSRRANKSTTASSASRGCHGSTITEAALIAPACTNRRHPSESPER